MDSRAVFFLTFMFTFVGTCLVALSCYLTGQGAVSTILYTVSSMWILGVSSLILIQNAYQTIIMPLEEEKLEELESAKKKERNLKEIERIENDPTLEKVKTSQNVPLDENEQEKASEEKVEV